MFSAYPYTNPKVKTVMKFLNRLWWKYMPGVTVKVRWPAGEIVVNHEDPRWVDLGGAVWVNLGFSADPNDHYRWFLEKYVGQQGWDWDWDLKDRDVTENLLTIRFRRRHQHWASVVALKWA